MDEKEKNDLTQTGPDTTSTGVDTNDAQEQNTVPEATGAGAAQETAEPIHADAEVSGEGVQATEPAATLEQAPKKKKIGFIIAGIFAVLMLGIAGLIIYFTFFVTTSVDIFYNVTLVYDGSNGHATLVDGSKPYSKDETTRLALENVLYYTTDATDLKNGDVITVTAVIDQEQMDANRLVPETLTKEFTVEGLWSVPATIGEISNEADLRSKSGEGLDEEWQKDRDKIMAEDPGATITVDNHYLYAIAYKPDYEKCGDDAVALMTCGTIQYIYRHELETESSTWWHSMKSWLSNGFTNVADTPNGPSYNRWYVESGDQFDTNGDGHADEEEMKAGFEKIGYTFVLQ